MFARYDYKAGSTLSEVMADIALLLTGTTAKASLSASCVQATTDIVSTVAAGWSVYDAAAGTNAQVFRALCADGVTYKYMWIQLTATTFEVRCYESWNATTHVGTNLAATTVGIVGSTDSRFAPASGGTLFLSTSVQYVHMIGFVGTTWGYCKSVMERSRLSAWDTLANGVTPVLYSTGGWTLGPHQGSYPGGTLVADLTAPRSKSAAFANVTGTSAGYTAVTLLGSNYQGGAQQFAKSPDASGTPQYIGTDIYAANAPRGDLGGMLYGIKAVSTGGITSDDVTLGGQTYFYMTVVAGSGFCFAIPKF